MPKTIECVPNFSDGKRPEVVKAIVAQIEAIPGVSLLGSELDSDLNRSVVTFIGSPDAVCEAAFQAIAKAVQLINIVLHQGEHPRMGIADVCPFIPFQNATMEECIALAQKLGKRVGEELKIPVYLYEAAATRPERKNLSNIRNQQFENLQYLIGKDSAYDPDYGPALIHPTAGAIAIGARSFLIAYNVNLRTTDVAVARAIAKKIREKDGGLPAVKALGFCLNSRQMVQVSTNLCDHQKTSMKQVFDAVATEAMAQGIEVADSELVGLVPADAVAAIMQASLKLRDFSPSRILEQRVAELAQEPLRSTNAFMESLAAPTPTPGGGSAAALAGSMAAALGQMATGITLKGKKYQHLAEIFQPLTAKLQALQQHLFHLVREDSDAYQSFVQARKMAETTPEEKKARDEAMQKAIIRSLLIPLDTMKQSLAVMEILPMLAEKGNPNLISDVGVACHLSLAAMEGAALNVRINLTQIADAEIINAMQKEVAEILHKGNELKAAVIQKISLP